MRKYETCWKQLRTTNKISIIAPSYLHKRITKAVCKEKYRDENYKLGLIVQNKRARLHVDSQLNKLTFRIKISIGGIGV